MTLSETIKKLINHGFIVEFSNHGYNCNLVRLTKGGGRMQVMLPNDHLSDERVCEYFDLLRLEVDKQIKEKQLDRQADEIIDEIKKNWTK